MHQQERRNLAGQIIRDTIEQIRPRITMQIAAARAGISLDTLYAVLNGEERRNTATLRGLEVAFDLPPRLLTWIIDGDTGRINHAQMPDDLRDRILYDIAEIEAGSDGPGAQRRRQA